MSLFDPDATGDAKNIVVPDGSFPSRGNGLIGDSAAQPEVVVVANGGSDLIYVPARTSLMAERIVQFLSTQDYTSGIFVNTRFGPIGGTLPLPAAALEGSAITPTPSIVVNFRSFSVGCADIAACGVEVADTPLQQGQGIAGSFSRADTRSVMAAAGPDFRQVTRLGPGQHGRSRQDNAALLGLKTKDKGKLTGRVMTEALLNGRPVRPKPGC